MYLLSCFHLHYYFDYYITKVWDSLILFSWLSNCAFKERMNWLRIMIMIICYNNPLICCCCWIIDACIEGKDGIVEWTLPVTCWINAIRKSSSSKSESSSSGCDKDICRFIQWRENLSSTYLLTTLQHELRCLFERTFEW